MRLFKRMGLAGMVLLAGIQFIRPETVNPVSDPSRSIESYIQIPEDIRTILTRACYDCHSHQTNWPWYSHVAPVSWLVARDVREGRKHLNLSAWGDYTKKRMGEKLAQMATEVDEGNMPMPAYGLLHAEADLTKDQRKRLVGWAEEESEKIQSGEDEAKSEDE